MKLGVVIILSLLFATGCKTAMNASQAKVDPVPPTMEEYSRQLEAYHKLIRVFDLGQREMRRNPERIERLGAMMSTIKATWSCLTPTGGKQQIGIATAGQGSLMFGRARYRLLEAGTHSPIGYLNEEDGLSADGGEPLVDSVHMDVTLDGDGKTIVGYVFGTGKFSKKELVSFVCQGALTEGGEGTAGRFRSLNLAFNRASRAMKARPESVGLLDQVLNRTQTTDTWACVDPEGASSSHRIETDGSGNVRFDQANYRLTDKGRYVDHFGYVLDAKLDSRTALPIIGGWRLDIAFDPAETNVLYGYISAKTDSATKPEIVRWVCQTSP